MNLQFVFLDSEESGLAMAFMPDASLLKLQALLDTDKIEIVNVNIQGSDYYMLVDENARLRKKPLNILASIVASQTILGEAAAVLPEDFKSLPFDMERENDAMH